VVWLHAYLDPWSGLPAAWWLSLGLGVMLLGWSVWRIKAMRCGQLVWAPTPDTGIPAPQEVGAWTLHHPDWPRGLPLRRVRCAVDLNQLMILEVRSASGQGVWVWCSQARLPSQWLALRRAVHGGRHKELHVGRPGRRNR